VAVLPSNPVNNAQPLSSPVAVLPSNPVNDQPFSSPVAVLPSNPVNVHTLSLPLDVLHSNPVNVQSLSSPVAVLPSNLFSFNHNRSNRNVQNFSFVSTPTQQQNIFDTNNNNNNNSDSGTSRDCNHDNDDIKFTVKRRGLKRVSIEMFYTCDEVEKNSDN
jgi:hypothetical protein